MGKEVIKAWSPPAKCLELHVELWHMADEINGDKGDGGEPTARDTIWKALRSMNYKHRGFQLPSPGVVFTVESMPGYAGQADSNLGYIRISENIDPRALQDTFRHELAHIVTNAHGRIGMHASHGKEWKKWARELGAQPIARNPIWSWTGRTRTFGDVELELPKTKTLVGKPTILIASANGYLRAIEQSWDVDALKSARRGGKGVVKCA